MAPNKLRRKALRMAQYAIAFDLDTKRMRNDGLSDSDRTLIYQKEVQEALEKCGFTEHPQGSLYHTLVERDPIPAIMDLKETLKEHAPNFCKYVRRVHVFRMEEWSDVTPMLSTHSAAGEPTGEEELDEAEDLEGSVSGNLFDRKEE